MALVTRRLLILAVVVVALGIATAWVRAQSPAVPKSFELVVISGPDIGFRVERNWRGKPVGSLVVRIDGEWKEVQFAPRAQVLTP